MNLYGKDQITDCFDVVTEKDCFYCCPSKENVITKLAFATEEIYRMEADKKKVKK